MIVLEVILENACRSIYGEMAHKKALCVYVGVCIHMHVHIHREEGCDEAHEAVLTERDLGKVI